MKTLYITYNQLGVVKKATINEQRYTEMQSDSTITNLVIYPNQLLMENNYNTMLNGKGGDRQVLMG